MRGHVANRLHELAQLLGSRGDAVMRGRNGGSVRVRGSRSRMRGLVEEVARRVGFLSGGGEGQSVDRPLGSGYKL